MHIAITQRSLQYGPYGPRSHRNIFTPKISHKSASCALRIIQHPYMFWHLALGAACCSWCSYMSSIYNRFDRRATHTARDAHFECIVHVTGTRKELEWIIKFELFLYCPNKNTMRIMRYNLILNRFEYQLLYINKKMFKQRSNIYSINRIQLNDSLESNSEVITRDIYIYLLKYYYIIFYLLVSKHANMHSVVS